VCGAQQEFCGGKCDDVTSDSANCGACGRDCLGAPCVASECQPVKVASSQAQPIAIATDVNNIFWLNEGTAAASYTDANVMRLQRGKTTPQTLASNIHVYVPVSGLQLDSTNVYFNEGKLGWIESVPKDGSASAAPILQNVNMYTMSLTGTSLFWIDYNPNQPPYWHMNAVSTNGSGFATINSAQSACYWFASDSIALYITCTAAGTILKMSLDGQTVSTLASNQKYPNTVVLDATSVYWTNNGSSNGSPGTYAGTVSTVSKTGGKVTDLITGIDIPYGIGVNDTYVYFLHDNEQTLSRVPKAGGKGVDLVQNGTLPCIAADDNGVYYCSGPNGKAGDVMMIAK
jgi:hypothetical protein